MSSSPSSGKKGNPVVDANITFATVLKVVFYLLIIAGIGYAIFFFGRKSYSDWRNKHPYGPGPEPGPGPVINTQGKPVKKPVTCPGTLLSGRFMIADSSYCEGNVNKDASYNQVYDIQGGVPAGTYMATQGGECYPLVVSDSSDVFCNETGGGEASDFNAYSNAPFMAGPVKLFKSS